MTTRINLQILALLRPYHRNILKDAQIGGENQYNLQIERRCLSCQSKRWKDLKVNNWCQKRAEMFELLLSNAYLAS